MVDRVFKFILLFTPIAYCVGVNYYRFELIFFQIASMILITSSLYDTPKRDFNIKKLITLFFGICLFSVIVNKFQTRSLLALINIFLGCINIYVLTVYLEDIKKCFKWFMFGLGINTLICIGQFLGFHPFIDSKKLGVEFGGIIGNAPRFATCIALALPFMKRYYLIPALIAGIFLTEVSIFFSIFVVLFYECKNDKQLIGLLLIIGLLAFGVLHKGILTSLLSRGKIFWSPLITQLAQRPLFGYGLGVFNICDPGFSSFGQWVYGVGILGIGFIVLCLRKIKWYLLPLVFLCLVEYPFEIPRLWPVIIFIIVYYAIEQKEEILC